MIQNFRHEARQAISRAKSLLEGDSVKPEHLRYAALDARLAMEALTYERAHSYRQELPESAYDTWQPRKLMQVLLDIDPNADTNSSLSFGLEETYGVPPAEMTFLGQETVLNLSTLKKHYDALGSYLHMPTLKQLQADGGPSFEKLKTRLDAIIAYVETVLDSPISNINFGSFITGQCVRCGTAVRWRVPHDAEKLEAVCRECNAPHDLTILEDQQVRLDARQHPIECAHPECGETSYIWGDQMKPGFAWICVACGQDNCLTLINQAMGADGQPLQT